MPRWSLFDASTSETYTFPINPNKMTSPHPAESTKIFARNSSLADDQSGVGRVLQQRAEPYSWSFSGVIRSEAQYDDFRDWTRRTHRLVVTDHFGREWSMRFDSIDIDEQKPTFRRPFRYQYTAKATVYGRVS